MDLSQTSGRQKEGWLKPYIAPNLDELARNRARTPGPLMQSHSVSSVQHHNPMEFGSYYGPNRPGGFHSAGSRGHGRTMSSSSYHQTSNYSSSAQTGGAMHRPQEIGGRDYYTLPAPKKQITPASLVSGQAEKPGPVDKVIPAWQQTAEYRRQMYETTGVREPERPQPYESAPQWTQTASQKRSQWESHGMRIDPYAHRPAPGPGPAPSWTQQADQKRSLYEHEADALRQRGMMETELSRRSHQSHSYQTSTQTHQGGGPSSHTTVSTTAGARPLWQQAQGASTKSQVQGSYKDPQGHDVAYKKEVYTTSDPGKEFSMQMEEEKKVFEEPVQPGVISRHTTTKYYKKSTYNSTSTTSSTQAPPMIAFSQMPTSLAPPGPVGAGITQF